MDQGPSVVRRTAAHGTNGEARLRSVHIITTPVKASGKIQQTAYSILQFISRSKLVWSTHWVIRVGDSYFELQRVSDRPQPVLRASSSFAERQKDVISEQFIGYTNLCDEDIIRLGDAWFKDFADSLWYDIFANNCQSFVYNILEEILPGSERLSEGDGPLAITGVSFFLTRIVAIPILFLLTIYLHFRGCDPDIRSKYFRMLYMFIWYLWARVFIATNQFREVLFRAPVSIASVLIGIYLAIIWIPIYIWHAVRQVPLIYKEKGEKWMILNGFMLERDKVAEVRAVQEISRRAVVIVPGFWIILFTTMYLQICFVLLVLRKLGLLA